MNGDGRGSSMGASSGMPWTYNDGGRAAAGFKGSTRDCVTRAIAIATGRTYSDVYAAINDEARRERPRGGKARSSARTGVHRETYERLLLSLGFRWVPTMRVGQGTTVHLRAGEVPMTGTVIVKASRHVCTVINGVVQDTHDPSRGGTRCVYGYYVAPEAKP